MTDTLTLLREGTRSLHRQAERAGVMPALLQGRLDRLRYSLLLRNLHAIYTALEDALDRHAAHPALVPVRLPALYRTAALSHDLAALYGPNWSHLLLLPATTRYVSGIAHMADSRPQLLAADVYVRYLGDLSGGQILRRILSGSTALGGVDALQFYDFGEPGQVQALAAHLRAGLAAWPGDAADVDALVARAQEAFDLHIALFSQIEDQGLAA